MAYPRLSWDIGTAYDLFVSLKVIHSPLAYGLRASWAAGVRSRLPMDLRETLELFSTVVHLPLHWIHALPQPRNGAAALRQLELIPSSERIATLVFPPNPPNPYREILMNVSPAKKWSEQEVKILRETMRIPYYIATSDYIDLLRKFWTQRDEMSDRLLPALKAYHDSFFVEEEARIMPALQLGLSHAQRRAGSLHVKALLEELSQGIRFDEFIEIPELILAPSFWSAPFVFFDSVDTHTNMLLFGSRPDDFALIPGEVIPEALIRGLKALADPTRLRILRSLSEGPQTPTQLARSLRLRTPTVVHHLFELRLAGLIQVTISSEGERLYATRLEGVLGTQESLEKFINGE